MCEKLAELRDAVVEYAERLDVDVLSAPQVECVVRLAAAIEGVAATVRSVAASRLAVTGSWKTSGERSAAHHLARATGTSVAGAVRIIDTGRRIADLPEVNAAARRGELSAEQTAVVADAASASPSSEARLVEMAARSSLSELREECARTKAAAVPDLEARRRSIHARRQLRSYTDAEGAWNLRMRDTPEVGAQVMAALEPIRDRLFREARAEGRREPLAAYAADALVALARGEKPKSGRAEVIARIDLDTLLRGYPLEGETCEIAGYGPVAVSAVRDLIDTGDPFLAAVVTKGKAVVGATHLGRRPNTRQQTALEWLYPSCAVEGCGAVAFLENDHRVDWAASHVTVLDRLDRLCSHHHDRKSRENWALVPGRGKRAFVPPGDPRHPRHAGNVSHAHDPPAA